MQDIRRQVVIAVRWLPLVVIGAIAAGAIAFALTSGQPKVYATTARLIVDAGQNPTTQDLAVAQGQVALYAELADTSSVADDVIEELGLSESADSVRDRISTDIDAESLTLAINVRGADPEAARLLAHTVGEVLRLRVRDRVMTDEVRGADRAISANQAAIRFSQRRLDNLIAKPNKTPQDRLDVQSLFSQISALQSDIQLLQRSSSAFVRNKLNWFEAPSAPTSPVEPRPMYWTLLALVVGAMLGAGVGFVIEFLNDKVRDARDLEAATGLTTVGSISEDRADISRGGLERLVLLRRPGTPGAQAYRSLQARIDLASGPVRTLMVASADQSDCKSTVAANLALAYADAGRTVFLVDADYRTPRLHSFFGVANELGISTVLANGDMAALPATVSTPHPMLRLLPAGPPPPEASSLLGSSRIRELVASLLQVADMVIFDTPSMASNLGAAVLATHVQEAVLVVPSGSRGKVAAEAARALQSADTYLVGTIIYHKVRGSRKRAATAPPVSVVKDGTGHPFSEGAASSPPKQLRKSPIALLSALRGTALAGSDNGSAAAGSANGSASAGSANRSASAGSANVSASAGSVKVSTRARAANGSAPTSDPEATGVASTSPAPGPYAGEYRPPGFTTPDGSR